MTRRSRGITLLEVMVVVAIAGILSAIAAGGLRSLASRTRVAETVRTVGSAMRGARTRAIATGCFHFVQINGPNYAGVSAGIAGFPRLYNQAFVVRKANCDATQARFEVGDQVVDSFPLHTGPRDSVEYIVPPALGTTLNANAFTVGWDRLGTRFNAADTAGAGALSFADTTATLAGAVITLIVQVPANVGVNAQVGGGTVNIDANGRVRFP